MLPYNPTLIYCWKLNGRITDGFAISSHETYCNWLAHFVLGYHTCHLWLQLVKPSLLKEKSCAVAFRVLSPLSTYSCVTNNQSSLLLYAIISAQSYKFGRYVVEYQFFSSQQWKKPVFMIFCYSFFKLFSMPNLLFRMHPLYIPSVMNQLSFYHLINLVPYFHYTPHKISLR